MKDSYLTAGIRFRPLVRLLARNKISWTPRNIARILFLFQSSCWSSLFSRIEAITYRDVISNTPEPQDPVFIVGHWRTGSTFLHQLMAQDPGFTPPTLFQVALPENFLVSYRFYKPIFTMLMGKTRPMDNVLIGMDEPQEDEYAFFRQTTFSPLERIIFPKEMNYFLQQASFLPEGQGLTQWEHAIKTFYKKIFAATGKRIISKNPFNSMRVPLLAELFPEAKFIHIVRHPYAVVPSTLHLWNIVQKQNILNRNGYVPTVDEVSAFFSRFSDKLITDLSLLPGERHAEIRYEDLEQNPLESLQSLYRSLNLPFSEQFGNQLLAFSDSNKAYKKNVFSLSPGERKVIAGAMRNYMARYGYMENV